jgi:hypothetical protein
MTALVRSQDLGLRSTSAIHANQPVVTRSLPEGENVEEVQLQLSVAPVLRFERVTDWQPAGLGSSGVFQPNKH